MDNYSASNSKKVFGSNKPEGLTTFIKGSPYYHHYNKACDQAKKISPYMVHYDSAYKLTYKDSRSQAFGAPPKRKKRVLLTIFIIILSIVLLGGGGVVWFFKDVIFNKPQASQLGEYYGLFAYAPTMDGEVAFIDYSSKLTEYASQIEAGIADDATPEQKALAAYIIYRIGCLANATVPYKARYGTGSGSATGVADLGSSEITVAGGMNVTATSSEIRYPMTRPSSVQEVYGPSYQLYVAGEEYTQIPAEAVTSSNPAILDVAVPILRATLPFARRYISTPDYKTVWNARIGTCVIEKEKVTAEFVPKARSITKRSQASILAEELAKGIARDYDETWGDIYGLTSRDMALHIINPDTILGDTVIIKKELGTSIDMQNIEFYSVEFEVDTETNKGTPQSATYYAEQFYKGQAPDIFMNYLKDYYLHYSDLKVKFEVFANGYFRTWSTIETWSMGGKVGDSATVELISENDSMEAFCYDYDTVMQGFVNRYYGDQEHVGMPMSALPFNNLLQGYTQQEYGSYR